MRLCTCLTLALVTAAALGGAPVPAVAAADDRRPTCAGDDDGAFPIRTRIRGGPATYVAGGGFGTWSLELTNTTSRTCGNIHPVVVLVDSGRTLERTQPHLEYYENAEATTSRPVTFERTDSDELVGVLGAAGTGTGNGNASSDSDGDEDGGGDGDRDGFTVPPGRTLTVKLRLSLTSDAAAPNDVVAKAAVVERRGDDGEWVGESNDYRFRITDDEEEGEEEGEAEGEADGRERDRESGTDNDRDSDRESDRESDTEPGTEPGTETDKDSRTEEDLGSGRDPESTDDAVRDGGRPYPEELAETGMRQALPYVTGLLLLAAGGLLTAAVRRRAG